MGSGENGAWCRCLLLAALAVHLIASATPIGTEVSAGVAATPDDSPHHQPDGADWMSDLTSAAEKRAYYVSEYKRLPVYNFGLGKRSDSSANRYYAFGLGKRERPAGRQQYSFGLGKRPNNLYSFGLGKRSMEYSAPENTLEEEQEQAEEGAEDYLEDGEEGVSEEKRGGGPYAFGLGKRYSKGAYSFGLGKRAPKYGFGLGKRLPAPGGASRNYAFGLGKRLNRQYSFGLGKRQEN